MHFSEIIKLQYGKKTPYIALYLTVFFFRTIVALLSKKKKQTSIALAKICFPHKVINRAKVLLY